MNYPRQNEKHITSRRIWKMKNKLHNQKCVISALAAEKQELERRLTSCRQEIVVLKEKIANPDCSACMENPFRFVGDELRRDYHHPDPTS